MILIAIPQPIAKNALTILINISSDLEVLKLLAEDDAFLETILGRITVCQLAQLLFLHPLSIYLVSDTGLTVSSAPKNLTQMT